MDMKTRLETTKFIWMILGIVLAFLFISAGIGEGLESAHVVMGVGTLIAATISTGFIWNFEDVQQTNIDEMKDQEKAKRERIDTVLRDLSNEDLVALKQRLSDGSIDDDLLYEHMTLSDDGELISLER